MHDGLARLRVVLQLGPTRRPATSIRRPISYSATFEKVVGGTPVADHWRVSSLTEADYPGIIPLPGLPGTTNFVYGGTPSDPSDRALHPGFEEPRIPRRLLSVPARNGVWLPLARAHHPFARHFERGDERGQRLPRVGDAGAVHARQRQSDGRLFGLDSSTGPIVE